MDENAKLNPTHVDYWIADAGKLKQAADLCWVARDNIKQNAENAKLFGLEQSLIEAADDALAELNWLYPNLIAFAIQHLAIGILLSRNPRQIIEQGPHYPIMKAIETCGVRINPELVEVISEVENSYRWNDKIPRWSVRLSAEQIQTLKRHKSAIDTVTLQQKISFDALFDELTQLAFKEMESGDGKNLSQRAPDDERRNDSSSV